MQKRETSKNKTLAMVTSTFIVDIFNKVVTVGWVKTQGGESSGA